MSFCLTHCPSELTRTIILIRYKGQSLAYKGVRWAMSGTSYLCIEWQLEYREYNDETIS